MEDNGETRDDIKLPDNDVGKEIKDKFDRDEQIMVTVLSACGEELAVGHKPLTK